MIGVPSMNDYTTECTLLDINKIINDEVHSLFSLIDKMDKDKSQQSEVKLLTLLVKIKRANVYTFVHPQSIEDLAKFISSDQEHLDNALTIIYRIKYTIMLNLSKLAILHQRDINEYYHTLVIAPLIDMVNINRLTTDSSDDSSELIPDIIKYGMVFSRTDTNLTIDEYLKDNSDVVMLLLLNLHLNLEIMTNNP